MRRRLAWALAASALVAAAALGVWLYAGLLLPGPPLREAARVHVEEGVVRSDGVTGRLTGGADVCLTERDWLVTEGAARLRARSTTEVLADGTLWRHLLTHAARLLGISRRALIYKMEKYGLKPPPAGGGTAPKK